MRSRPSLFGRALLAAALLVGFYLLAIGLAGGLLALIWLDWRTSGRIHARLALPCAAGAAAILLAAMPRRERFKLKSVPLARRDHPRLFALLEDVAASCGEPMPAEVHLVPEANAFVTARGGVMGFGATRLLGIGLPVLAALTQAQLRAVIAHELGHFHSGDVKLGPWIHATRSSLLRTVGALRERRRLLHLPFELYARLFLRVTQGVSRAQELAADALAIRIAGSDVHVRALEAVHVEMAAWNDYVRTEYSVAIRAERRPPLVEGFRRYLRAPRIEAKLARDLAERRAKDDTCALDTHPSLAGRLAAARSLPRVAGRDNCASALELLEDAEALEPQVLALMFGRRWVESLEPLAWERYERDVLVPSWRPREAEHAAMLEGKRVADVPALVVRIAEKMRAARTPEEADHAQSLLALLQIALCRAFADAGLEPHGPPGEPMTFTRDGITLTPYDDLVQLATRKRTDDAWLRPHTALGLLDRPLLPQESRTPAPARA